MKKTPALSPDQGQALIEISEFLSSGRAEHALSGPAGTGKSYLMRYALPLANGKVRLSATTNKAAAVAAQLAPGAEARTIHHLLGLSPEPDHRRGRMVLKRQRPPKIKAGELVVVDEASMIDSDLLRVIRADAAEIGFKMLFVGDNYQLPPIFEGESPAFAGVPTSRLTTVQRQALESPIIRAATGFREVLDGAEFPVLESEAAGLVRADARVFEERLLSEYGDAYASDPDHVRAVAWTNNRVHELNKLIRRHLVGSDADRWPLIPGEVFVVNDAILDEDSLQFPSESRVEVTRAVPAYLGDKPSGIAVRGWQVTIQNRKNAGEVFVPEDRAAAKALVSAYAARANSLQRDCASWKAAGRTPPVALDQDRRAAWRDFFKVKGEMADLRPPHACTVHKAQGSTYRHVFIDIGDIGRCTRADLIARLTYVALTRPRESAVFTGDLPARLYYREAA